MSWLTYTITSLFKNNKSIYCLAFICLCVSTPWHVHATEWGFLDKNNDESKYLYYDKRSVAVFKSFIRLRTKVVFQNDDDFDGEDNLGYRVPIDYFVAEVLIDCKNRKKATLSANYYDKKGRLLDDVPSCFYDWQSFDGNALTESICNKLLLAR